MDHHEQSENKAEVSRQNADKRKQSSVHAAKEERTPTFSEPIAETREEMEARIRQELLNEKQAREEKTETEEEMRERIRKEMGE